MTDMTEAHDTAAPTPAPGAPEPDGGSWLSALACHWKGALAAALVAGAAAAMADNPMQRSTQVQFLASAANAPKEADVTPADLARALSSAGIPDEGRDVTVTAKADRESDLVAVSFAVAREASEADAALLALGLVERAASALSPQIERAARGVRARKAALEEVSRLIDERMPGPAGTTEAMAMLVKRQNELRLRIAADLGPVGKVHGPEIVGTVHAVASAPAPMLTRSRFELQRENRAAARV